MNETRYKAFISYSHVDEKWADWLQRSLESYRVPKHLIRDGEQKDPATGGLAPIFRDRSELPAAADLGSVIREALDQSSCLLVICSPAAARSRWVNQEILEFKRLGREHRIFCLIVDGEPNVGDRAGFEECFPEALRFRVGPDGALTDIPAEPIAADVRAGKDGKPDAKLKLIAGLLGVGFDTLKQRDLHRSHQRMAVIATAATLGVIMTSVLAAYAFLAQDEAERQREHAQDLVGFMVGDMRTRLEPIGQILIMEAVGEELLEYFSSEPPDPSNSDMTTLYAQSLRLVGEIRIVQNRVEEGENLFSQAMSVVDAALLGNADDEGLLFEASQMHFWIADSHRRHARRDLAVEHIQSYLDISLRLATSHPENSKYQQEVAYAYRNLGTLAYESGDTARAETLFHMAMDLWQTLVSEDSSNINFRAELANTISWFGSLEWRRGSLTTALARYEDELQVRRAIAEQTSDPEHKFLLAGAYRWVGWTLSAMGHQEAAIAPQLEAQALYRELEDHDPENFEWAREYYWSQIHLGKDLLRLRRLREAHENLVVVEQRLAPTAEDNQNAAVARLRSALMVGFARYSLALGDREAAAAYAARALEFLESYVLVADRESPLIEYAEAAYVLAEATDSREVALRAIETLDGRGEESPELKSIKLLLTFSAGYMDRASDYRRALGESEFTVPFVPESKVAQWLAEPLAR